MPGMGYSIPGAGAYGPLRPRRYGRGGYWTDMGQKYGAKVGGWLGGKAMSYLSGGGAYKRRAYKGSGSYNEVSEGRMAPLPPSFATKKSDDYVEINHREFLGDIISSGSASTFATQTFNINAGDSLCFPWLSQIAQTSFQQYQFQGLIFEFKSMSADALNSTNTALGSVIASVNYDATDAAPTTRAQMENMDWSQCCKPSESFAIPVECKRSETWGRGLLFTRQSLSVPSGSDRKTFDLGSLTIATAGIQGTSVNLGSLYVTYKVRLYKTVQFAPLINAGFFHMIASGAAVTTLYLGTTATQITEANNMGVTFSNTVITIPLTRLIPGAVYEMTVLWVGGSAATAGVTITLGGSISAYTGLSINGTTLGSAVVTSAGTATGLFARQLFQVSAAPTAAGTLTFSAGTLPAATCSVDVMIYQRNGDTTNLP